MHDLRRRRFPLLAGRLLRQRVRTARKPRRENELPRFKGFLDPDLELVWERVCRAEQKNLHFRGLGRGRN